MYIQYIHVHNVALIYQFIQNTTNTSLHKPWSKLVYAAAAWCGPTACANLTSSWANNTTTQQLHLPSAKLCMYMYIHCSWPQVGDTLQNLWPFFWKQFRVSHSCDESFFIVPSHLVWVADVYFRCNRVVSFQCTTLNLFGWKKWQELHVAQTQIQCVTKKWATIGPFFQRKSVVRSDSWFANHQMHIDYNLP